MNSPKAIVLEISPLTGFQPLWRFREWSKFINLDDTAKQVSVTFAKAITLALQTKKTVYIKTIGVSGFNLMSIERYFSKRAKQKIYDSKLWGLEDGRLFMTAKGEKENLTYNEIQDYVFNLFVMYNSAYLPLTQFPDSNGSLEVVRKNFMYEHLITSNLKKENVDYCILGNHGNFVNYFFTSEDRWLEWHTPKPSDKADLEMRHATKIKVEI